MNAMAPRIAFSPSRALQMAAMAQSDRMIEDNSFVYSNYIAGIIPIIIS